MEQYTINVDTNVDTSGTSALNAGARAAGAFERMIDRARKAVERFNSVQRQAARMNPGGGAPRNALTGQFQNTPGARGKGVGSGSGGFNITVGIRDFASRTIATITGGLTKLVRTPFNVAVKLTQAAGSVIGGIGRMAGGAVQGAGRLAGGVLGAVTSPTAIIGAGAGLAAAGVGLAAWPLQLAANMEQAQVAFEVMLGSASKAQDLLGQLRDFANKTPFAFPELRDASQKLLAFGFDAKNVIPMLTAIGDAVSGIGGSMEDQGNRVVRAFGQIRAKGRVQSEEMLQLQELGIPALEILTKGWSKLHPEVIQSTEDMQNAITAGIIPAATSLGILMEGLEQKFPNMMQKQQKTLSGLANTIQDTFNNRFVLNWGMGLATAVAPRLQMLADWFETNEASVAGFEGGLNRLGKAVGEGFMNTLEGAVRWFGRLMPSIAKAPDLFAVLGIIGRQAFEDITARMGPFGQFIKDAIRVYIPNLVRWVQTAALTFQSWLPTFALIQARAQQFFGVIQKLLGGDIGGAAAGYGQGILDQLKPWIPVIQNWVMGTFVPWVQTTVYPWLMEAMTTAGAALWQWIEQAVPIAQARLADFLTTTIDWAVTNLPTWVSQMLTWVQGATGWILEAATAMVPYLGTFLGGLLTWVADNAPPLTEKLLSEWVPAFVGWVARAAVDLLPKLGSFLAAIAQWVATDALPQLARFGALMGAAIIRGMIGGIANLYNQLPEGMRNELEKIPALRGLQVLGQAGTALANGVTAGANSATNSGALTGGLRQADAEAVSRAQSMLGATTMTINGVTETVVNKCERFIETLYGTAGAFTSARTAGDALIDQASVGSSLANAPAGASVFFSNYGDTGGAGHVGIATGRGTFISALAGGITESKPGDADWNYWNKYYRGYGRASYGKGASGGGGLVGPGGAGAPLAPGTTLAGLQLAPGAMPYASQYEAAAGRFNLDPRLLYFQGLQETGGFGADVISGQRRSGAGARGIAQFMPATGEAFARKLGVSTDQFWSDPNLQITAQAMYMRELLNQFGGDTSQALGGYNWGQGNVQSKGLANAPAETQNYIRTIMGNLQGAGAATVQVDTINVNGMDKPTEQIAREIADALAAELATGLAASGENRPR